MGPRPGNGEVVEPPGTVVEGVPVPVPMPGVPVPGMPVPGVPVPGVPVPGVPVPGVPVPGVPVPGVPGVVGVVGVPPLQKKNEKIRRTILILKLCYKLNNMSIVTLTRRC